ncbi:MAG: NAD(P)-dependent oxidoreductase, partial [Planctomycetota bacterium]|nr:NAD(P)-dependent oxidoreductase [Planctomycetota bacterium]
MSYLITGACGCIGSWIVKQLLDEGQPITVFDLQKTIHRLELIMPAEQIERVDFVEGDITDLNAVKNAMSEKGVDRIIHLAALQVPACKANPILGRKVNIDGTRNIFQAASDLKEKIKTVAFASSVAVYGPESDYVDAYGEDPVLPNDAPQTPRTVYGETKKQSELEAIEFSEKDGIPRLGIRPWAVYGPGRDFGLTSDPTKAMKAAAIGRNYEIGFGHLIDMQYVADIANAFIQLSKQDEFVGAKSYNIKGWWVEVAEVIQAIEEVALKAEGTITHS